MRLTSALMLLAVVAGAPAAGAGEFVITPNAGVVFGGDLDDFSGDDPEDDATQATFGLGLGYFSDSLLGFEVDFTYTPEFFGEEADLAPDNNLTTLMANIVLSGRFGESSRIYASGGAGLMKADIDDAGDIFDDLSSDDLGANVGAGLIFSLGERVGLRGDVRYFRNLTGDDDEDDELIDVDFGNFDFWRASGGLSLKF